MRPWYTVAAIIRHWVSNLHLELQILDINKKLSFIHSHSKPVGLLVIIVCESSWYITKYNFLLIFILPSFFFFSTGIQMENKLNRKRPIPLLLFTIPTYLFWDKKSLVLYHAAYFCLIKNCDQSVLGWRNIKSKPKA